MPSRFRGIPENRPSGIRDRLHDLAPAASDELARIPRCSGGGWRAAEFNYKLDIKGIEVTPTRFQLRPEVFHVSDKTLDYSVVAVSPSSMDGSVKLSAMGYHRLVQETGKLAKDEPITIIQHPEGGYRQVSLRENQLVAEPKPEDLFLVYRSDTAQGSSGSPGFNDSWQAVTLHHSGKAREEGGRISSAMVAGSTL